MSSQLCQLVRWQLLLCPHTSGSFPNLIRPMHTENGRNRALRACLLRDLWLDGNNRLVAEHAGMLRVKRSCSNRHNTGGWKRDRQHGVRERV
jgi:hypothetical protein